MTEKILIVDDEPNILGLLHEILEDEGFQVKVASSVAQARKELTHGEPDLILLDIWMPDVDGISLLRECVKKFRMRCPIIVMSGHGTVETAVEATRLGAYDFIEKPLSTPKLLLTIQHALETATLQRENLQLKDGKKTTALPIGKSQAMRELREQMQQAAQHDAPVLIIGEPGTDKELYARSLHALSGRARGAFIAVPTLGMVGMDRQQENGASDNGQKWLNLFAKARDGTLFIREPARLNLETQTLLYQILQRQERARTEQRDTGERQARIISASQQDLEQAVGKRTMLNDLCYQLSVLPLRIPPLREHCEDIPELLEFFVTQLVEQEKLPYRHFTVASQNRLRGCAWHGNMRELRNFVQRLLIMGTSEKIEVAEIEEFIDRETNFPVQGSLPDFDLPLRQARENFEKTYLEHQLKRLDYNISKVASSIGMERTHLYRKIKALGIKIRHV